MGSIVRLVDYGLQPRLREAETVSNADHVPAPPLTWQEGVCDALGDCRFHAHNLRLALGRLRRSIFRVPDPDISLDPRPGRVRR